MDESLVTETSAAIDAAWSSWGALDSHVIASMINPAFMGGPEWPGLREAHTITRRDDALLVASSGLADPAEWSDAEPTNGFGLEVYGISPDVPTDSDTIEVAASWLGDLVRSMSDQVAYLGFKIPAMLDAYDLITFALQDFDLPREADDFLDDEGTVVLMLGLTDAELPTTVPGPLSPVRLVNVKLLTAAEGRFCVDNAIGSANARRELARRFAEQGNPLRSSLSRPSVV